MENNKTMTIEEVLGITIANLQGINIPVEASETIGVVICGCIRNLIACTEALAKERQKAAGCSCCQPKEEEQEAEEDEREADAE